MNRWTLFALMAVGVASLGDVYHWIGMQEIDKIDGTSSVYGMTVGMLHSHTIWLSLGLQVVFFFLWMVVLKKLDLSIAVPLTAANYIYVAVLSHEMMKDPISIRRLIGIGIIVAGVVLVTRSQPLPPTDVLKER